MKEVISFLENLKENNNRPWFEAHKGEYLGVKDYIMDFTQNLISRIALFEPAAGYLRPTDCTYRIYRDTRFSSDKTPYKTHIGIFINPPEGKKSERMGYYLHIEPGAFSIGVGNVCLQPKIIQNIRWSIRDNIEEYLEIINNSQFKKYFTHIGENPVKTAPKGFSKDWEFIELVRPRDYYVSHNLKEREVTAKNFINKSAEIFETAKPFVDFINYAVDEILGEP